MADVADAPVERRASVQAQDENRLAELGYKQELNRDWSVMHNFGVSFSIIVRTALSIEFPEQLCM